MRLEEILLKPLITEKAVGRQQAANEYFFRVHPAAGKHQIRLAVEKLFKVRVIRVHTLKVPGKRRRVGRHVGLASDWKKAIVRLAPKDTIKIFEAT